MPQSLSEALELANQVQVAFDTWYGPRVVGVEINRYEPHRVRYRLIHPGSPTHDWWIDDGQVNLHPSSYLTETLEHFGHIWNLRSAGTLRGRRDRVEINRDLPEFRSPLAKLCEVEARIKAA